MADRLVRPIVPASDRKLRFSESLQSPNVVVLGDPGAGKSHLFRSFAPPGALFAAREFLNRSPASLQGRTTLFIDALDEKRSGRADAAPVDLIVQRLLELTPSYVRIACRAADWLGTSDLGAFRPYFNATGGFTVLALEALTEAECADVLRERGCTDPAAFMAEAHARGVGDLLGNPQNLTLLFNVVRTHQWPHTRSELYQQAVEVLLTESNDEHQHKVAGGYSAMELVLPAGAACAARLIADVSGLSLTSTSVAGCPTYRDLAFVPAPQMHAALTRPAFVLTDASDTVDYGHRTIAEYLAARFLAQQVRDGLPFDRVRALMCVEGRPASELRGVHAWLAVLLSEHAQELINADPFGVLSYGDAAALSVCDRAVLLEAMSELAKQDPWFRHGNWSAAPLRGLAGADMVDRFRAILQRNNNFSLVSVVLDAASVGTPMPALQPDFLRTLTQPTRRDGERLLALQALLHLGPTAHPSCVSAYASIVAGAGGFHLRTSVLRRLFRLGLVGPTEVAELLNDALTTTPSPVIGMGLYDFAGQVPDHMLRPILDGVRLQGLPTKGPDNHQAREALQVLDRLMARCLVGNASDLHYVAAWLTARAHTTRYHGYTIDEALQAAVKSDPERLQLLIDAALPHVQEKEAWPVVVRLGQIYPGAADMPTILTWALRKLEASPATPDPLHYGAASRGPVFITDRGRPAHVLLTIEDYQQLAGSHTSIVDQLAMPGIEDIEFDPPRLGGGLPRPAELS